MQSQRRRLGAEGEAYAAVHLERQGYRVIDRNVRAGGVEIDLVARRARQIVFVEVKTRRGRRHGAPEEAVDARKRARLVRGAAAWLRSHDVRPKRVRFDVIAVDVAPDGGFALRHLEGAFEAAD